MCERKTWTAEQDKILRQLYEERGIKKWSSIASIMESSYHIEGRNGKQCRQRYHNHLKDGIIKQKWTKEEEQLLVELHSEHGNRWAYISKLIKGRTQNCVKNMLYSKLRKSVRQLNRFSYLYYRKTLKEIKISFINRLIEFTEAAYKKPENERTAVQTTAIYLKNEILKQDTCEVHELEEAEKEKIKGLVEQIHTFKRDNQKYYRGNILAKSKRQKLKTKDSNFSLGEDEVKQEELPSQPIRELKRSTRKRVLGATSIKVQSMKEQIVQQVCEKMLQQNLTMASISRDQTTCATPNQTFPLRQRVSVMRGDSLESNFQNLLVDAGLERPIQIDNYIQNLTPTPQHHGLNVLDWGVASNGWKLNFYE